MNRLLQTVLPTLVVFVSGLASANDKVEQENSPKTEQPQSQQAPPQAEPPVDPKILENRVEAALKLFSFEPTLAQLKRAALAYQDADRHSSRKWRKAPNKAALLPTFKFVLDRDVERDESLDRYQDEPDKWGADTDRDLGFQVSLQWRLDELIFNSDEIRVWSALADRASRRESILMLLVSYYFERRKLQLQLHLAPPVNLMEMAALHLKVAELTSSIDALTGGYLSKALETKKDNH